eukprot:jgi/Picsp_1/1761/NSC_05233-R1_exosome complex exonuclease rrp40
MTNEEEDVKQGNIAAASSTRIVLPGDIVLEKLPDTGVIQLGSGLTVCGGTGSSASIRATKAGILQQISRGDQAEMMWVLSKQKKYLPSTNDSVIGIVRNKYPEHYEVDLNSPFYGLLPVLAFEGATKRNRPLVKAGDAVYCRVTRVDPDLPATLSCTEASGKAGGFGPLPAKGGMVFPVGTAYARHLLQSSTAQQQRGGSTILHTIGSKIAFEAAIGMNGRIWVTASSSIEVAIVGACIQACEHNIAFSTSDTESKNQDQVGGQNTMENKNVFNSRTILSVLQKCSKSIANGGGGAGFSVFRNTV